jgi:hypothetical protein
MQPKKLPNTNSYTLKKEKMKKQFLKIAMFCLVSLSWSIGAIAQHYEGGASENYNEDAVDNSFDYSMPNIQFQQSNMSNNHQTLTSKQNDDGSISTGNIVNPMGGTTTTDDNGSAIDGIPDPLPDTPIDSAIYILLVGVLIYGYLMFRKKKSSKS